MYMMIFIFMMILYLFSLKDHYLMFLIGSEYIVVSILFYMLFYNYMLIFLIFLVFSVCEAVLGLSLLISLNFEYGHQKISMMNLC